MLEIYEDHKYKIGHYFHIQHFEMKHINVINIKLVTF